MAVMQQQGSSLARAGARRHPRPARRAAAVCRAEAAPTKGASGAAEHAGVLSKRELLGLSATAAMLTAAGAADAAEPEVTHKVTTCTLLPAVARRAPAAGPVNVHGRAPAPSPQL